MSVILYRVVDGLYFGDKALAPAGAPVPDGWTDTAPSEDPSGGVPLRFDGAAYAPVDPDWWAAELAARAAAALAARRAAKLEQVKVEYARRMAEGAPFAGKRIDVSDRGRVDLGGMVGAAMLAGNGTIPWSEGYGSWIALDNTHVPLPTPAHGIRLAAAVGDWYARSRQCARDLKDQVLAAPNPDLIDVFSGWPQEPPADG